MLYVQNRSAATHLVCLAAVLPEGILKQRCVELLKEGVKALAVWETQRPDVLPRHKRHSVLFGLKRELLIHLSADSVLQQVDVTICEANWFDRLAALRSW